MPCSAPGPPPPALSRELSIRAQLLEEGGSDTWVAFMEELRTLHLGTPKKPGARSVFAELHAAYEKVLTEVETEAG